MASWRTDLALEQHRGLGGKLPGVVCEEGQRQGLPLTTVRVTTAEGARALGKPEGVYHTLDLAAVTRREEGAMARAVAVLRELLTPLLPQEGEVLVVGLGNRAITPDAIGPKTCDHLLVTRHLVEMIPEHFGRVRSVSALAAGVMAATGVESGELALAVVERLRPAAVIAVDALCARQVERLCATVQVGDTGISPGSGVGNHRFSLNRETLGVPVIALGVPTVVEGATLCADLLAQAGVEKPENLPGGGLLVTPKDIDQRVEDMGRLLGRAVSLALQPGLTEEELEALVG